MAYNIDHLRTAGRVTIYTTLVGIFAFAVVFLLNIGNPTDNTASAQSDSASTTVTVLNTPPDWTASATEAVESSITNPTNAGEQVSWVAVGDDANNEPYYLPVCSNSAQPTANSGSAPECDSSAVQWAVSASTASGNQATAATTTTASSSPFGGESFEWYAWICDDNAGTPRCSNDFTQGTNATNSSPFVVNHRPDFTAFWDDSPTDPGATVTFTATSSDPDSNGGVDTVQLHVCSVPGFSTSTDSCTGSTLATSTFEVSDPTATYTVTIPTQDQNYGAYGYIIDEHGFESLGSASGTDSVLTVNNVAPATSTSISLNGGLDMTLTEESGETTGFTFSFTAVDDNSCENAASSDEIVDYDLSIYRSGVGSTTCTNAAGAYDPNNCYPSDLATTTWDLNCTASSTSCTGPSDRTQLWECTFPLWYIADPTDAGTQFPGEDWRAQVRAIDDDAAVGQFTEGTTPVEVESFLAFALNTLTIPYGSLEPGQDTGTLNATTTVLATGNVGLDKDVQGEDMCTTYTTASPCTPSPSSTIPAAEQEFATSTLAYGDGTSLSSTSPQEIEINVPKSRSTSTATSSDAYWGIAVPGTITFAGDYEGENTFTAIVGESSEW